MDNHSQAPLKRVKPQKKHHIGRWIIGIVVVLILAIAGYGTYLYESVHNAADKTYTPLKKGTSTADAKVANNKPISILLLGTDTGSLGRTEKNGRSDTIIVVTLNPKKKTTTMTSIPRDTMAQMVGASGTNIQKVNAAYSIGGENMATDTVSSLLNVPLDYYAVVNMGGMEKVVDAVGGVDVDVPFSFTSKTDPTHTHFKKGMMHLNGKQALGYARMRYEDPEGDYGRQKRQQQVIMGILKSAPSLKTLANFSTLLKSVDSNFRTNMSFDTMKSVYTDYKDSSKTVRRDLLKGDGATIDGLSYQVAPTKEIQRVSDEIRQNLGLNTQTVNNIETQTNAKNASFFSNPGSSSYQVNQSQGK